MLKFKNYYLRLEIKNKIDFRNILFYVKDLKSSVEFYEKAFGFKRNCYYEERGYAEIATNKTSIGFLNEEFARKNSNNDSNINTKELSPKFEIIFILKNVEEAYEKAIKEGATSISKPTLMQWNQTIAYVRDINGIVISLASE